jgi:hypothetical protein
MKFQSLFRASDKYIYFLQEFLSPASTCLPDGLEFNRVRTQLAGAIKEKKKDSIEFYQDEVDYMVAQVILPCTSKGHKKPDHQDDRFPVVWLLQMFIRIDEVMLKERPG